MSRRKTHVIQRIYDLCDYALGYCEELNGCEKCVLHGIKLKYDREAECPIYVLSELRDKMVKKGAEDGRYPDYK